MYGTRALVGAASFVAASAVLVATAAPASATASVHLTAGCGYGQTCTGTAQDVPGRGTGADVAVSCSAYTPYEVQATIVQCFIKGNAGDVHYTPRKLTQGQASTLTHTFGAWSLTSRTYQICVGAGLYSTGGTHNAPTGFSCGAAV